jgi:aspartate/methionine/tyrosine aminotransferase
MAGDAELIGVMKEVRPRIGAATPEFIQKAAIAAWGDEAHVEEQRERYAERRALFLEVFRGKGLVVEASAAAFYLWVRVPEGMGDSFAFAERLMEAGVIVLPGGFMGPRGNGYFRLAFVPRMEVCEEAAGILERVL